MILGTAFDYPIVLDNNLNLNPNPNIQTIITKCKSVKNLSYLPKNLINLYLQKYHHSNAILPKTINLYLHNSYNKEINLNSTNIKNVFFGSSYNKPIKFNNSHIKSLIFGKCFNCILNNIPNTIESISINSYGYDFGFDYLPNSIKELKIHISNYFNKSLDNLPNSIQELEIDISFCHYNHNLDNLPNNIKKLKLLLQSKYTNSLSNLPDSIEELTINNLNLLNAKKLPKNLRVLNSIKVDSLVFDKKNIILPRDKKIIELIQDFNKISNFN